MVDLQAWLFGDSAKTLIESRESENSGRGLFALQDIPPNTPLLTIPAPYLLNKFTLERQYSAYNSIALDTTQLATLHLLLHRNNPKDFFAPFINSLPKSFAGHPLSWLINPSKKHKALVKNIPPTCLRQLIDVEQRFQKDVDVIQKYISSSPKLPDPDHFSLDELAWAWLNVNTRCLYLRTSPAPSITEDLTLCPFVDLANHTSDSALSCEFIPNYASGITPPDHSTTGIVEAPKSVTFLSPPTLLKQGDQVLLEYGKHSNGFLWAEYGFVLPREGELIGDSVEVDHLITPTLDKDGKIEEMLKRWGYFGEWTVHTSPPPAYPSYRLVTVLRLLALPREALIEAISHDPDSSPYESNRENSYEAPSSSFEPSDDDNDEFASDPKHFNSSTSEPGEDTYERWKAVVLGMSEDVSPHNEKAWRLLLRGMCETLFKQSNGALLTMPGDQDKGAVEHDWEIYARQCLKTLWEEVRDVSAGIIASLDTDVQFG